MIRTLTTQPRSIQTRLTRLIIAVVMGTFLVIGVVAMIAIRSGARVTLSQEQRAEITEISRALDAYLADAADDVRQLANGLSARAFAGETITVASSALDTAQQRLLGEFVSLAQQHPGEYLEMRYVTRSGSVWTQVTGYDGIQTDTSVYLNQLTGDEALSASLQGQANSVIMGPLLFLRDATGQQINPPRSILRFSAPVASPTDATNIPGVIQVDVDASRLLAIVNEASVGATFPGRRLMLVNGLGQTLADTFAPEDTYPRRGVPSESSSFSINEPALDQVLRNQTNEFVAVDVGARIFSSANVSLGNSPTMPWRVLLIDDSARALGGADATSFGVLVLALAVGGAISLLTHVALTRTLRPLSNAAVIAQKLATEGEAKPITLPKHDDEIGQLIQAFQQISGRVENLSQDLESQVGRYTRNLEIASRIGRETATLYDIDQLLNRAITLIVEEFQYYHAQVFLVDDIGSYAVLFYSYGEAGKRLLEQQHKIEVGSASVIGTVTSTGQALAVNDTAQGQNIPHRFNPLLPDTRAELAIPLNIGDQVIGALDVQSVQPDAFGDEEMRTFQLLADQIAVAIYNARLLQQSNERIEQIDSLNRQLTRIAWQDVEARVGLDNVYRYDLFNVEPGDTTTAPTKDRITAPIVIRGEVIGTLAAEPPENLEFSEGDVAILRAVADRVALAIENARLFQETQSSLAQTSILYQISRFLNEADTLDDIVQAIIVSVMPDAISGQVGVFNQYGDMQSPEWMEIAVDWSIVERDSQSAGLPGVQLRLPDHPILRDMNPSQVTLINNVERDERLDDTLRHLFVSMEAQAAVFIPFSVRGIWRGVILVEFPEVREFGEREGRIYGTLIDQVGVAIDNRLLLRQTELALSQIERLYTASRIINTAQNTEDLVYAALSTTTDETLNFELALFEGDLDATGWPTRLRLVARTDSRAVLPDDSVFDVQIAEDSPLRRREPEIIVDRNPDDPDVSPLVKYLRARGNHFGAAFPLFSANQPMALYLITAENQRDLSAEDFEVYRALTGQMSTVLQNRRLLEQTAEVLDETRRLYAASRAITSAQDYESVYQSAAEHLAGSQAELSRVVLLLAAPTPSPDAPYLDYHYVWARDGGGGGGVLVGARLSTDDAPFARILAQAGGAVYLNDLPRDLANRASLLALLNEAGAKSVVVAPVQTGRKWLGVLVVESDKTEFFNEQYVRFAQAIADQIAIAVDNRQLFEEAQAEARRALALAEAGQLATQIGGAFEDSLAEVFARVSEPAGYDRWLLMLLDETGKRLNAVTHNLPGEAPQSFDITQKSNHSIIDAVRFNRMLLINDLNSYPSFATYQAHFLEDVGRHIVTPIRVGEKVTGALLVGRGLHSAELDDRDEQLVATLAAQVGIAVENRRLFEQAEGERQTLRATLETLPAGVLVLDAMTYKPLQFNGQAEALLGRSIDLNTPFTPVDYNIYRTGTNVHYPSDELPVFAVTPDNPQAQVDDVAVVHGEGMQTDLLVNAAPIYDVRGNISAIVAAFTDISNLRSLENTLQDNLRDTIALYEATRALAEVDEEDDILDLVAGQMESLMPTWGYVLLLDEVEGVRVVRTTEGAPRPFPLPDDILNAQHPLLVQDTRVRNELSESTRQALLAQGVLGLASLPLRARSRRDVPIGWLVITFDQPRYMTPEEERFVTTISDSAAIALDNRHLFQGTETALRETASLYGATTSISRARDMDDLSDALLTSLENMQPDMYAAYLLSNEGTEPTALFNVSMDAEAARFDGLLARHAASLVDNIFVDDLRLREAPTPFEAEMLALGNVRSFAVINIGIKGAAKGYLIIAYHQPHRFIDTEARYLGTVADSASVIIDNILLFDQIQNTLDETSVLYQASRALGDATTPRDILDVVVSHLIDETTTLTFVASLNTGDWNEPGAHVQIASSWQRDAEGDLGLTGVTLTAEQFPAWKQLAAPSILMIDDVQSDETLSPMERMGIESLDVRSLAVIPLRAGRQAIGSILLGSRDAHHYSERDQRVFQSFAEQASLKMEAARLLEQTERRARQLATSAEVARSASTILDLTVLLPRLVDLIRDAFTYDHVQIFLMDAEDDFAELRASTGDAGRQLLAINHKLQKGSASVIGQVTSKGAPTIALDTADASVVHRPNPYLPNTRSEMAVPLIVKNQVVGALDVQSNQPNAFDDDDVSVLTTLAAQISVAIDNARLFDQARRRASEMSFLFGVTTAAASADTLQSALQNVSQELRDSLDSLTVSIYLPDENEETGDTLLRPVALAGSDQPLSELSEIDMATGVRNLIASAAETRRPVIIGNIDLESRYLPIVADARSAVIVPLTSGTQLIGLVTMESDQINAYDNETLTLLLTLSGTLSAIIQSQQLLEQVQRQNDELRTLDRLKSDFLANMSHELRTPLNSIIGFSRVILKGIDGPLTEMQEQDLTTIYTSGQHLLNLINDILDQAKISANKMDLQTDFFDMKQVIDGVRSIGIGLIKDKPIDIFVDISSGLPKAFGDEFRTRQILLNLVSNASKFTKEGNITIRVYTQPDEDTNLTMIRVDVTDTGIGIAEKDIPLLFEAFRQVDSSLTRTVGGTGLGLPIAKSLVEMQGGRMYVSSTVNVGSTFSITVPTEPQESRRTGTGQLEDDTVDEEPKDETLPKVKDDTAYNRATIEHQPVPMQMVKRQILIIEDNPDMVDQIRRSLQREGFDVFAATIPLEAEAMASGLHPTIIIMDVNFAGGQGWDILHKMKTRDDTLDIPVIVVTLEADSERVIGAGAFRYIQRPFMPDVLVQAVQDAERESRIDRILIIDDQPESVRLLQELLQEHGDYRVFNAYSGQDGIALVARRRPNLIILDLRMPEMDGFAVVQELRNNPETATIPILVVTGDSLTTEERERLNNLHVLFKTDINLQQYLQFIEGVKTHLAKNNGD